MTTSTCLKKLLGDEIQLPKPEIHKQLTTDLGECFLLTIDCPGLRRRRCPNRVERPEVKSGGGLHPATTKLLLAPPQCANRSAGEAAGEVTGGGVITSLGLSATPTIDPPTTEVAAAATHEGGGVEARLITETVSAAMKRPTVTTAQQREPSFVATPASSRRI